MTDLKEYRVTWEIDLYAEGPEHAAHLAREMQLDPASPATVFAVKPWRKAPGEMSKLQSDAVTAVDVAELEPVA